MRVGLTTTAIFGDLSGYFFGIFRDKASSIIYATYATPCIARAVSQPIATDIDNRHVQLTRCFFAVAELLVPVCIPLLTSLHMPDEYTVYTVCIVDFTSCALST